MGSKTHCTTLRHQTNIHASALVCFFLLLPTLCTILTSPEGQSTVSPPPVYLSHFHLLKSALSP